MDGTEILARLTERFGAGVLGTHAEHGDHTLLVAREALLITNDLDFGELVYVGGMRHAGVLLLRLGPAPYAAQAELVARTLSAHGESLRGAFSVLTETRLRTRS